jgi:hypothetical protein
MDTIKMKTINDFDTDNQHETAHDEDMDFSSFRAHQ